MTERIDLNLELVLAARAVQPRHLARLRRAGLTPANFVRLMMLMIAAEAPFGVALITPVEDGDFYTPTEAGTEAVVIPVIEGQDVVDLVGVPIDDLGRWYLRLGHGVILGAAEMTRAQRRDSPLHLHACPWHWLVSGGTGAVVLFPDDPPSDLPRRLMVDDTALARRLDAALNPRRYRIRKVEVRHVA
ncbi:hypothetical protein [Desertibaculum subflavum]|uniref:hypothetical protein n=1 Tax=Desertibaculum subflavum TaxID=2268458 RepID=UPI000E66B2E1